MMTDNNIKEAAGILKNGGVVAFPTETVYGLGANALDPIAVAKIFALKERPSFDPLIVHIASIDDLALLSNNVHENVYRLVEKFWPGPLTIVMPKSHVVPDIVTSDLPTVGIRMPNNEIALQLIKEAKCPVAAPSANKFGQLSPVKAKHVKKQLPNVDYILDGGKTSVGVESTIVAIEGNVCQLLRPGYITLDDIEQALPGVFEFEVPTQSKIVAPGLLKSHYSPAKPLFFVTDNIVDFPKGTGVIVHSNKGQNYKADRIIYTSEDYNKIEITANLFSSLHTMEEDDSIKQIYIEKVDEEGLGIAIMDRLNKAAYRYQSEE